MAKVTVWRMVSREHAQAPFSGEGARLFGGRWNSKGRAVCYLADSPALCQLEVLVNTRDPRQLEAKVLFRVRFKEQYLDVVERDALPDGRDACPPQAASQRVGDAWLAEERSLALRVPSVLSPYGATYLLNPRHPRFSGAVQTSEGAPYPFDERLVEWEEA
ncbi:MAG: hypothetical protein BRD40_03745 [Bacteroidetes bacterium QS_1_65_9]|nr:MAG: hypothetical protein BRD40_03745 [Bacteroidetes bacterium QS_1_65_9]